MEIRGDLLTDKENAGAALLDACKEIKTSDPVQIGSYRGYAMSVEFSAWKQEYTLLLKGQMTHRATLGTDPRGKFHGYGIATVAADLHRIGGFDLLAGIQKGCAGVLLIGQQIAADLDVYKRQA